MFELLLAVIYLAFISLGLPDSLLGSAWPTVYPEFGVPVSYMGIISMIISLGTIISSLLTDRLTRALGAGRVTALSVGMTAAAIMGFSFSHSFIALCLWAVPYGLGAGSVDAALNNYVALHYESRHMSWLHCMWGIGTITSPVFMSYAIGSGRGWNMGYRYVAVIQIIITAVLFLSLPLWKPDAAQNDGGKAAKHITLPEALKISGAKEVLLCFFGYCALESTAGQWAGSYLTLCRGVSAETAAAFAGLFYLGITAGRAVSGFITMKLDDENMIRLGQLILGAGVAAVLLPLGDTAALAGLVLMGLGCAPIYPSIIHSTPAHFGAELSQTMLGLQMAFAYIGNLVMPPLFGIIAGRISPALYPVYLLALLALMIYTHERLMNRTAAQ